MYDGNLCGRRKEQLRIPHMLRSRIENVQLVRLLQPRFAQQLPLRGSLFRLQKSPLSTKIEKNVIF